MGNYLCRPKDEFWIGPNGVKMNNDFWVGPYGVLVPIDISYVIAVDNTNYFYKRGIITPFASNFHLTEQEYKKKYAKYNNHDNKWYYFNVQQY